MKRHSFVAPAFFDRFLVEKQRALGKRSFKNLVGAVRGLHAWMEIKGLRIEKLTLSDVDAFTRSPAGRPIKPGSARVLKKRIKVYLRWLYQHGYVDIPTRDLFPTRARGVPRKELPAEAEAFLREMASQWHGSTCRHYRHALYRFHRWLEQGKLSASDLELRHVIQLRHDLEREGLGAISVGSLRFKVKAYLGWQFEKGLIKASPNDLFPDSKPGSPKFDPSYLPEHADRFLSFLRTTLRPSTVYHYRNAVLQLHTFLARRGRSLATLERTHIEEWFCQLKELNKGASYRQQITVSIRGYFNWLYEHGYIRTSPDQLVKNSDIPKRPRYLPRPLPPHVDQEVMRRLASSPDVRHKALLLMRLTGLRVGELAGLSFDCMREDFNGNKFLKVPLGKLNSERMVPLPPEAIALVKEIQEATRNAFRSDPRRGKPDWLFYSQRGTKHCPATMNYLLRSICAGIETEKPITSHRLRHTYATSLLNGGMSLVGIMHLLGHNSIKMTLRYAAVTQDTVAEEYFSAIDRIKLKYRLDRTHPLLTGAVDDPKEALSSIIRWLKRHMKGNPKHHHRRIELLLKRIHRFKTEIDVLTE